jgi:hypothetical protein
MPTELMCGWTQEAQEMARHCQETKFKECD